MKYLNNVIEADHGKRKRLIKPTSGFPSLKTAYATLKGFEVMRALKKRQTRAFQIQDGFWVRYAWLSGRSVAGPMPWLKPSNTSGPCSIPRRLHLPENRTITLHPLRQIFCNSAVPNSFRSFPANPRISRASMGFISLPFSRSVAQLRWSKRSNTSPPCCVRWWLRMPEKGRFPPFVRFCQFFAAAPYETPFRTTARA